MTETVLANIINEYTITNNEDGVKLYKVVEDIRNMPSGELMDIHYMSLNDKLRMKLETNNMLLTTLIDGSVVILELDIEANGTSWVVEPKWDENDRLYFELSNPVKVYEQVSVC